MHGPEPGPHLTPGAGSAGPWHCRSPPERGLGSVPFSLTLRSAPLTPAAMRSSHARRCNPSPPPLLVHVGECIPHNGGRAWENGEDHTAVSPLRALASDSPAAGPPHSMTQPSLPPPPARLLRAWTVARRRHAGRSVEAVSARQRDRAPPVRSGPPSRLRPASRPLAPPANGPERRRRGVDLGLSGAGLPQSGSDAEGEQRPVDRGRTSSCGEIPPSLPPSPSLRDPPPPPSRIRARAALPGRDRRRRGWGTPAGRVPAPG